MHSDADAGLPYVAEADVAVRLPGDSPTDTYLRADLLVDASRAAGADAVHPGYGFLSENADFARAVMAAGLTWVGPEPESIELMGSKVEAKKRMADAGVPLLTDLDPKRMKIVSVDALPAELAYVDKGIAPVLLAQPVYMWGYVGVQTIVAGRAEEHDAGALMIRPRGPQIDADLREAVHQVAGEREHASLDELAADLFEEFETGERADDADEVWDAALEASRVGIELALAHIPVPHVRRGQPTGAGGRPVEVSVIYI